MGYTGWSMTLCVVCRERVQHKDALVVGRKPNGKPRLVHRGRCMKKFKENETRIRSRWIENRRSDNATCA